MTTEKSIAQLLLQSKAIMLQPANPFVWASGWRAPIYCDNRRTQSFPEIRTSIKEAFIQIIREKFSDIQCVAGVATGAIAQGALVADALQLPFVYVRSAPKDHGLENLVEGIIEPDSKVIIIEDLVSTGSSCIKAVHALRQAGGQVAGLCAIFTYGFKVATENFKNHECPFYALTNYNAIIDLALETGYINPDELQILKRWRENPESWSK